LRIGSALREAREGNEMIQARNAKLLNVYKFYGVWYLCFREDSERLKPGFVSRKGLIMELYSEEMQHIGGPEAWTEGK